MPVLDQLTVDLGVGPIVDTLARKERCIARVRHQHSAEHLTHDELDVLVVNRHALVAVDLLDLFDQVLLGLADALDLQELLGVLGPFDEGVPGPDILAVHHLEVGTLGDEDGVLFASFCHHGDLASALVFLDADNAGLTSQDGGTLGGTGFEELDDAGQTVGDVARRRCHRCGRYAW